MSEVWIVDIDGTLCTNTHGKYAEAEPLKENIARVNAAYEAGHRIELLTARGTTTGLDWRWLTEVQLRQWGVKYHSLEFGKRHYDRWIDDKAENWT